MGLKAYNLRPPVKQRGGSMQVSGYLAIALLAIAIAEAGLINYLYHHRTIQLGPIVQVQQGIELTPYVPPDQDLYHTHTFPAKRTVCTALDTICWIRI